MLKKFTVLLLSVTICLICFCSCFGKYVDWHEVEIPTKTPLRATVKIPDHWTFVNQDGWLNIVNIETGEIIAEEWIKGGCKQSRNSQLYSIVNWEELTFNPNATIAPSERSDLDLKYGGSNSAYIYKFAKESLEPFTLISLEIFYVLDGQDPSEYLYLVFRDDIDYETIKQMAESYSWGGVLEV